ncbi:hypothetical protein JW979_13635 [bacterium]|nr:hypothetical protein [candidate division CSSED10-310 bacterium]
MNQFLYSIGGIKFLLDCPYPLETSEAAYSEFLQPKKIRAADTIPISISIAENIPYQRQDVIVDSESWEIQKQNLDYRLIQRSSKTSDPIAVADFTIPMHGISFTCSEIFINRTHRSAVIHNPMMYPLDQILITYALSMHKGMIVHGAGVYDEHMGGMVFCGRSGAGKTTISRIIDRALPNGCILSDDRVILRYENTHCFFYGTPWPGEGRYAVNTGKPLKILLFLKHGKETSLRKLPPGESLDQLLPVATIPWYDKDMIRIFLDTCDVFIREIPCYELTFIPEDTVLEVIRDTLANLGVG